MNTIRSKSLIALGTAMLAGSLFFTVNVSADQSDTMSHDGKMMQKQDTMGKNTMKKDTMGHGTMGKDSMKQDTMGHDSMGKDSMKQDTMGHDSMKHDSMGNDQMMKNGDDN